VLQLRVGRGKEEGQGKEKEGGENSMIGGTEYTLRPYQTGAVNAAVKFLKNPYRYNAIEVLPTGSGKSLVIAATAKALDAPVLIFQPTKEILEQNYAKYLSYGYHAGVYSASVGRKDISKVTFATIGSVKSKAELFQNFRYIIIDECHFVNPKQGMYSTFLKQVEGAKVLGLTATPYRLVTDGFGGSILKFLTRTRPRVFMDLIYHVQNSQLFREGYLAKLKYTNPYGNLFDRSQLKLNTTGADYTDESVKRYYRSSNFQDRLVDTIRETANRRKNVLVFTRFVEEAQYLVSKVPYSAIVTAESSKKEREYIIEGFRNGKIRTVCNVGVLTTGFDYPELETIVIARPTMSLALYYQMIGRGIRPHPLKEYTEVIDMCRNGELFGKVEDLEIKDGGNGKWFLAGNGGRQLTNIYFGERGGGKTNARNRYRSRTGRGGVGGFRYGKQKGY
jgi:DNA repair protein RadD